MTEYQKIAEVFAEKFSHIIPSRIDAKVIFSLFLRLKENPDKTSDSEQEIKELIRRFIRETGGSEREYRQKIEERLQILLRHQFLDRNKERRILLSDYSLQLCSLFFDKVQPLLKPSEIEKTLEDVKATLNNRISTLEDFKYWYENQFQKILKSQLATQTNAIEYQIAALENDLNERYKIMPFVDLIDYFNRQLDVVIQERRKLTKSFNGLDSINEILSNSYLNKLNSMEFIQIKSNLNETFEYYKYKLERTEDRISHIKKIASSIFDKIDKKPFYRKLEIFWVKVLEQSSSEKKSNRTDKDDNLYFDVDIILPDIPKVQHVKDVPDFFLYPEFYDQFGHSKNQTNQFPGKNHEYLQRKLEKSKKRQERSKRIAFLLTDIKKRLNKSGQLDYSKFY
ncbi:MAG: hypothetical protein C0490_11690, partial [Marivirga sp.]|nr:hypothetical protein [Marivirga sp.]